MKHKDIQAAEGKKSFTCRGPYRLPEAIREAGRQKLANLVRAGDVGGLHTMFAQLNAELRCAPPLDANERRQDVLVGSIQRCLFDRVGCGADLSVIILALPTNGEAHRFPCPECETVATVMRPCSDEARAEREAERDARLQAAVS